MKLNTNAESNVVHKWAYGPERGCLYLPKGKSPGFNTPVFLLQEVCRFSWYCSDCCLSCLYCSAMCKSCRRGEISLITVAYFATGLYVIWNLKVTWGNRVMLYIYKYMNGQRHLMSLILMMDAVGHFKTSGIYIRLHGVTFDQTLTWFNILLTFLKPSGNFTYHQV
jgi:hypothetical protein